MILFISLSLMGEDSFANVPFKVNFLFGILEVHKGVQLNLML